MLVTHILGDCPACGKSRQYGNVLIGDNKLLRGCMSCSYSTTIFLPQIRKQILYVDQFFFSSAFRNNDERFIHAAECLKRASSLQLLIAPFSSIHIDETHQWRGYGGKNKSDLIEFIKQTSHGHEFKKTYNIEETQVARAFKSFLNNESAEYVLRETDALERNIHSWDNYFRIDVNRYIGDIELIRNLKSKSIEQLIDVFADWRTSKTTFEQDVAQELHDTMMNYFQTHYTYVRRIKSGDYIAALDSPIISQIVHNLLHCIQNNMSLDDKFRKITQFFKSEYFFNTPIAWTTSRSYAVLKDMVKHGAYKSRKKSLENLSGFFQDIEHISTFAPYCDAFVMDKAMASIFNDKRIELAKRYNVKIFTLNNWDEFIDWINSLEKSMTIEHIAGLKAAYPQYNIL